jgi:hypothetical protein
MLLTPCAAVPGDYVLPVLQAMPGGAHAALLQGDARGDP